MQVFNSTITRDELDEMLDEVNKDRHEFVVEDPTVVNVLRRFETRSQFGMKHYGTSMHDNPSNVEFWITNAMEEAMDLTLYLQRLLEKLKEEPKYDKLLST